MKHRRRTLLALVPLVLMQACGADIHDREIASIDFTDAKQVDAVSGQLDQSERGAFMAFARKTAQDRASGAQPAAQPKTVRDALQSAKVEQGKRARLAQLLKERAEIIRRRSALVKPGAAPDPAATQERERLEQQISSYDWQIMSLERSK